MRAGYLGETMNLSLVSLFKRIAKHEASFGTLPARIFGSIVLGWILLEASFP